MRAKSDTKVRVSRWGCFILNLIEIYIPAIMLICLFFAFIVGIIFRYIFRDPQPWTFEISSIAFLQFAILSECFVQREDEHIVFDMIYTKRSKREQCIMRIIGGAIICFAATILIPVSFKYVGTMFGLKTQITKLPRWCVFACFPVGFVVMDARAIVRLIMDIRSFMHKTYDKSYPVMRK